MSSVGENPRARRRLAYGLCGLVMIGAGILVATSESERSLLSDRLHPTIADVALHPKRYAGTVVTVAGVVTRTGRGRFVVANRGGELLVVPGLREKRVRVRAGQRVRVRGRVRAVDPPPIPVRHQFRTTTAAR